MARNHFSCDHRNSYQEDREYFSELLQDHPETDPLSIPSDISIKEEIKIEDTEW